MSRPVSRPVRGSARGPVEIPTAAHPRAELIAGPLYHGTDTTALAGIAVAGLVPQPHWREVDGLLAAAHRRRPDTLVWLTRQLSYAQAAAAQRAEERGGRPVVLRVAPGAVVAVDRSDELGEGPYGQLLWTGDPVAPVHLERLVSGFRPRALVWAPLDASPPSSASS